MIRVQDNVGGSTDAGNNESGAVRTPRGYNQPPLAISTLVWFGFCLGVVISAALLLMR